NLVKAVQAKVDQAIDFAINWIVQKAKSLFKSLFGKKDKPDERTAAQKQQDLDDGVRDAYVLLQDEDSSIEDVRDRLGGLKTRYRLTALELVVDSSSPSGEVSHIHGEVNPP